MRSNLLWQASMPGDNMADEESLRHWLPAVGTVLAGVVAVVGTVVTLWPTAQGVDRTQRAEVDNMERFLGACADNADVWQSAETTIPAIVAVDLDEARTVAVNIRINEVARRDIPDDGDNTTEQILVRCALGARLVPVTDNIEADDLDWQHQEFTATGELDWAWTITATHPKTAQVRLELRPALAASEGGYVIPVDDRDSPSTKYTIDITVEASVLDKVNAWVSDNSGKVTAIGAFAAVVLGGLIGWLAKTRGALRELRAAGTPPPSRGRRRR